VIERTDTGVVDILFSDATTAGLSPTLPTSYTKKRRIGSFRTDGSSNIVAFSQNGDEFLWSAMRNDVANVNTLGTSAVSQTLTVPINVKVTARYRGHIEVSQAIGAAAAILFSSLDESDQAPSNLLNSLIGDASVVYQREAGEFATRTNTSAQIRYRATNSSVNFGLSIYTFGWLDTRGK
jgi:hypothetical protein